MVNSIAQEISLRSRNWPFHQLETIYFGGGTPSLLSAAEWATIWRNITSNFDLNSLSEVTVEANPEDLSEEGLSILQNTPANRLSIGVQSFQEDDLRFMNRSHTAKEALTCIERALQKQWTISIDLIYGTPGLSDVLWQKNLDHISALGIPHISAYALTVEKGTALDYQIKKQHTPPLDEAQSARQFLMLAEWAYQNGYDHYEVSNLALPNRNALHNTSYWQGKPYLGIGPSAHSFDGRKRSWNVANNNRYIHNVAQDIQNIHEEEWLTEKEKLHEYLMTGLRTRWGLDLIFIEKNFGRSHRERIELLVKKYPSQYFLAQEKDKIILSTEGWLFADGIASALFS